MLFNSFGFLVFFPVVTVFYFLLPQRYRWGLLLAASSFFYMAFIPVYIFVLLITITIDYLAAIGIEKSQGYQRKLFLIISILSTVAVLFIFKYFGFFNTQWTQFSHLLHWNYSVKTLQLILPIGLSFHTFQSLSYVIEVYRGRQKAEHHFGIYALYVMFYPQLVAGPIERPQNLIHQFYEKHSFDYARVTDGLRLMLWGFFKKVVIADRLAIVVNHVYDNPRACDGPLLILATFFFAFQIYCDFSGYSDIAIGAAQVMGFKLMTNFRQPYSAKSISEFWQRWHISLSTWFRDYLYFPLGGSRTTRGRWYFNLFLTFVISGLWHGANWTFILWGAINGFYLLSSIWFRPLRERGVAILGLQKIPRFHDGLKTASTFLLICFSWIFFRADNVTDAFYIVTHLFEGMENVLNLHFLKADLWNRAHLGFPPTQLLIAAASLLVLESVHRLQKKGSVQDLLQKNPIAFRWTLYYALILWIVFLKPLQTTQFLYFQF